VQLAIEWGRNIAILIFKKMKKKILSFMVFGVLLIVATPKKADAACARGTMSCGVETLACGDTVQEMIDDLEASDEVFCN